MPDEQAILDTLNSQSDAQLILAIEAAPTQAEKNAINAFLQARLAIDLKTLVNNFDKSSDQFLTLIDQLNGVMKSLSAQPGGAKSPLISRLAENASDAFRLYYHRVAPRSATENAAEAETPVNDEVTSPPPPPPPPGAGPAPPPPPPAAGAPHLPPKNSKDYAQLAAEYAEYFAVATIRQSVANVPNVTAIVRKNGDRALANKSRYEAVGNALGAIPWWFIAGVHQMESGFNFGTHLHNGDSLSARTHQVPAGRPKAMPASGHFPYTWEESAADALTMEKLNGLTDWSLPRALYRWEAYNGFGYRPRSVPTPYVWSFTTIYTSGRYIADHVFNNGSVSQQCGTAALLKELVNRGAVKV